MKKILTILGISIILSQLILATTNVVFAENSENSKEPPPEDILLNPFVDTDSGTNVKGSKASLVENLPTGSWQQILSDTIKLLLAVSGTLSLASFTVGGILFLSAQGDESKVGNAKKLILYSLLALGIIATSYAIVLGVSQLQFLGPQK